MQSKIVNLEGELEARTHFRKNNGEEPSVKQEVYNNLNNMYEALKTENENLNMRIQSFKPTLDELSGLRLLLEQKNDEIIDVREKNTELVKEAELYKLNALTTGKEKSSLIEENERLRKGAREFESERNKIRSDIESSASKVSTLGQELHDVK